MYFQLVAHEIAHNLGIYHDFHPKNGGIDVPGTGKCADVANRSIMSNGTKREIWSACSSENFEKYYRTVQDMWCMERKLSKNYKIQITESLSCLIYYFFSYV